MDRILADYVALDSFQAGTGASLVKNAPQENIPKSPALNIAKIVSLGSFLCEDLVCARIAPLVHFLTIRVQGCASLVPQANIPTLLAQLNARSVPEVISQNLAHLSVINALLDHSPAMVQANAPSVMQAHTVRLDL